MTASAFPRLAACIGLDWADARHEVSLQVPGSDTAKHATIEHWSCPDYAELFIVGATPEAEVERAWDEEIRRRLSPWKGPGAFRQRVWSGAFIGRR